MSLNMLMATQHHTFFFYMNLFFVFIFYIFSWKKSYFLLHYLLDIFPYLYFCIVVINICTFPIKQFLLSCLHLFILHLFKLRCGAHFLTIICCLLFTTFSLGMHFSLTCAFTVLLNFSEWMRLLLDQTIPPEGLAFGADRRKDFNFKILLFIERVAVWITYLLRNVWMVLILKKLKD